jgi:hypothetical protein
MSLRSATRIIGLAAVQSALAGPGAERMLARSLSSCAAALRTSSSEHVGVQQRAPPAGSTAAPLLHASSSAVAPLIRSRHACSHPANVSSQSCNITSGSMHTFSGRSAHDAVQQSSPQLRCTLHTSAASPAAQTAPTTDDRSAAAEDLLAGSPGDSQLTDMIEPQFLQTPNGQLAYHALPATGSHLTGVIYCGGEHASVIYSSGRLPVCTVETRGLHRGDTRSATTIGRHAAGRKAA